MHDPFWLPTCHTCEDLTPWASPSTKTVSLCLWTDHTKQNGKGQKKKGMLFGRPKRIVENKLSVTLVFFVLVINLEAQIARFSFILNTDNSQLFLCNVVDGSTLLELGGQSETYLPNCLLKTKQKTKKTCIIAFQQRKNWETKPSLFLAFVTR